MRNIQLSLVHSNLQILLKRDYFSSAHHDPSFSSLRGSSLPTFPTWLYLERSLVYALLVDCMHSRLLLIERLVPRTTLVTEWA